MPNFMDLSGELRNKIYRSLFVLDRRIELEYGIHLSEYQYDWDPESNEGVAEYQVKAEASAQLLRVSKQLCQEGVSILYGENRFHATGQKALTRVKIKIGDLGAFIKDLKIFQSGFKESGKYYELAFETFPNLRTLVISTNCSLHEFDTDYFRLPEGGPTKGDKVASKNFMLIPKHLPNFSKSLMDRFCSAKGLDVCLEVKLWGCWDTTDEVWGGRYLYHIQPTSAGTPRKSSLIEKNYDLVFRSTTAPCVDPVYSDDEDDENGPQAPQVQQSHQSQQTQQQTTQGDYPSIVSDSEEKEEEGEDEDSGDEDEEDSLSKHDSFRSTQPIFDSTTKAKFMGAAWKS